MNIKEHFYTSNSITAVPGVATLLRLPLTLIRLLFFLIMIINSPSNWSEENATSEFWNNWNIGVSAGYGARTNPLLNAEDIRTYINIDISWYGEQFFFDNGDLGYNLFYGDRLSLNLIGQLNNERVFFGKTNTQIISIGDQLSSGVDGNEDDIPSQPSEEPVEYKVADRNYAYEAGMEAILETDLGQFRLGLTTDITNQHKGHRAELSYRKTYIWQRFMIQPSIALSWKSASLTDYYFGVNQEETSYAIPEYSASSATNIDTRLLINYAIKKDLFWGIALGYESLDSTITESPIVTENNILTGYTGIKYRF